MKHLKIFEDIDFEKEQISGQADREKIELNFNEEEFNIFVFEDQETDEYVLIEDNLYDKDLDHGAITNMLIIKRKSDGKFFRGFYEQYEQGGIDYNHTFEEVFPEQKMMTIYR